MTEVRMQAQLELIQEILRCPRASWAGMLQEHTALVDEGFLALARQMMEMLAEAGQQGEANSLKQLIEMLGRQDNSDREGDLQFLMEVLRVTEESKSNPQAVYQILQRNLDRLHEGLAEVLRQWAQNALPQVKLEEAPQIGVAVSTFSTELINFPLGDRGTNVEIAIAGFESILTVFAREAFPQDWARTQTGLALAYSDRVRGEKADNIERAIDAYQLVLQVCTREAFPQHWATVQNMLAIAYRERIKGERAENIELAIDTCKKALQVYTSEVFPIEWAATQNNLAINYEERILEDRSNNMELAIEAYEKALQVRRREVFPQDWASTQCSLAIAYKKRILGDRADNVEKAINAYQLALQVYTREAFPQDWAEIQNCLAIIYQERVKEERADNIEKAINAYQLALQVYTRAAFPQDWATIQNNLAFAYRNRIRGERAENIERAIDACQLALKVYTREAFPQDWAATQNNLANAYGDRIRGERADNIERAIEAYQKALQIRTRETSPKDWAGTQNDLALAYNNRILRDRADNIEQAIKAYHLALQIYTKNAFPQEWASVQENLGNAYVDRVLGKQTDNFEQALEAYQKALQIFTRQAFPWEWAQVQMNLANAYTEFAREKSDNLERAIKAYRKALQIYTFNAFPQNWAAIQNNLANAYIKLGNSCNLEKAIQACQLALQIKTPETSPQDWARIQATLAKAYRNRIRGKKLDNFKQAEQAYMLALQIHTREAFPLEHTTNLADLGSMYSIFQEWLKAYYTLAEALDAFEDLRGEVRSGDEVKRKLNEEWLTLYHSIIEACLKLDKIDEALIYTDRAKARNLVELMAVRDIYPAGQVPEATRDRLRELRLKIAQEIRYLETLSNPNYDTVKQLRHKYREEFPYEPLTYNDIQILLSKDTSIIEWYFLSDKFIIFFASTDNIEVLQFSNSNQSDLLDWFCEEYLIPYVTEPDRWKKDLPNRLSQIAKFLHIEDVLTKIPVTCQNLILIPHLQLHMLPLHALPIQNSKGEASCLLDRFTSIRYAPSCQLLHLTQAQQHATLQSLLAIQNPTGDLTFTDIEVQAIQKLFDPHQQQTLPYHQATKAAFHAAGAEQAHCLHFSCHGYFNFRDPLQSALILADAVTPQGAIDLSKCLTLRDLFDLNLNQTRLVTLSACETGITDPTSLSDEYIGLPNGFLLAGVPNVVSSLWSVNDLSTALLIARFYQNLHANGATNVAIALNQAQHWLRDATTADLRTWSASLSLDPAARQQMQQTLEWFYDNERPFQSPYHWAAFCAIGQ